MCFYLSLFSVHHVGYSVYNLNTNNNSMLGSTRPGPAGLCTDLVKEVRVPSNGVEINKSATEQRIAAVVATVNRVTTLQHRGIPGHFPDTSCHS